MTGDAGTDTHISTAASQYCWRLIITVHLLNTQVFFCLKLIPTCDSLCPHDKIKHNTQIGLHHLVFMLQGLLLKVNINRCCKICMCMFISSLTSVRHIPHGVFEGPDDRIQHQFELGRGDGEERGEAVRVYSLQ